MSDFSDTEPPDAVDVEPAPMSADLHDPDRPAAPRWAIVVAVLAVVSAIVVVALDRIRVTSKVLSAPGSVLEIEPVVSISGIDSFPSVGEVHLTTVSSNLSPSIWEWLGAQLDPAVSIQDRERVLGDRSAEENRTLGFEQMAQSIDIAERVALEYLGYDVITEAGALIMEVSEGTPADGAVFRGDVVVQVGGEAILTSTELVDAVTSRRPGDELSISILEADGSIRVETIVLADRDGSAFMGVAIGTFVEMSDLPFEIDIDTRRIGGPSAGLALTLTVLDLLTEGELTGGLRVATTGTIDPLGGVGRIGGIEQKTHAVIRGGIDVFLVPAPDADTAREVAGDRVEVVGVATLQDALDALAERGGNAASLDRELATAG